MFFDYLTDGSEMLLNSIPGDPLLVEGVLSSRQIGCLHRPVHECVPALRVRALRIASLESDDEPGADVLLEGLVYEYPKKSGIWWAQLPEKEGKAGPKWRVSDRESGEVELRDQLRDYQAGIKIYDRSDTFGDWLVNCIELVAPQNTPTPARRRYRASRPDTHGVP